VNKRLIWALASAIAICTLSLIYVQLNWVVSVRQAEEDSFRRTVNIVLENVVYDVDEEETASFIAQEVRPYSRNTVDADADVDIDVDADIDVGIDIDIDSVAGLSKETAYQIQSTLREQDHLGDDKKIKTNLGQEAFLQNILTRIANSNLPIEDRISLQKLNTLLDKEFIKNEVRVPYEFGVTNELGELLFCTGGFQDMNPDFTYAALLFPKDPEYVDHYFLNVYIPYQTSIILNNIRVLIIASLLLVIIITSTFTANLSVIFKQKRLSEIKNDIVNNMTHELKTPITTISLAAQMLSDPNIPQKEQKLSYLSGTILAESKRLQFLVEKVLQIAIFERGNLKLKVKEIDLFALLSNIIRLFALQMEKNHITLNVDFDKIKGMVIWADEIHLTNVFTNLIDNAIKYRREDDAEIKIIAEKLGSDNIQVKVIDNGLGISSENLKKIFEKFYRVSTGNVHAVKGFGLGLSYAKKVVTMHRGTMEVNSKLGEGSTFTVTLPT
jgi:signal transduction histidine kinase